MKIVYEYSHLGGSEILQVKYPRINKEISKIISRISAKKSKISNEKTMKGRKLYSPKEMNSQFRKEFENRGLRTYEIRTLLQYLTVKRVYLVRSNKLILSKIKF